MALGLTQRLTEMSTRNISCGGRGGWSAAARLLELWVRIPTAGWMLVCCECCVLPGRSLCDELITRREGSQRLWCVVVCSLEASRMRRPWPALGRSSEWGEEYLVQKSGIVKKPPPPKKGEKLPKLLAGWQRK
jgi:hypothetical protein